MLLLDDSSVVDSIGTVLTAAVDCLHREDDNRLAGLLSLCLGRLGSHGLDLRRCDDKDLA